MLLVVLGNPRNKVALQPGHSLMDWIRLGASGKDLTGVGSKAGHLAVIEFLIYILCDTTAIKLKLDLFMSIESEKDIRSCFTVCLSFLIFQVDS